MLKKNVTTTTMALAALTAAVMSPTASAAISAYSSDFDTATDLTPWEFFADNGAGSGSGFGGYGGAAPSGGPQISALANDGAGNQYINFYANYDNAAIHANPPLQEAISLFVNQGFTGADTASGDTWTFNFDYADNVGIGPNVQVGAFIRVFDPGFALLAEQTFDTAAATAAFQSGTLSQTLNPLWTDGFIQFGFNNLVGDYEASGRFYDNISFSNSASAVPVPAAAWLFGSALAGLVAARRKQK